MRVRPRVESDRPVVEPFLARRHSSRVARLGALERPLEHPALVAEENGRLIGLLTYVVDGPPLRTTWRAIRARTGFWGVDRGVRASTSTAGSYRRGDPGDGKTSHSRPKLSRV